MYLPNEEDLRILEVEGPTKTNDDGQKKPTIGVIGAGMFGTALAEIAARADNNVILYARNNVVVEGINGQHRNPHYMTDYELSPLIVATNDVKEALTNVEFVILAIPTQEVRMFHFVTMVCDLLASSSLSAIGS